MNNSKKQIKVFYLLIFIVIVASYLANTGAISLALAESHLPIAQTSEPSYRVGDTRTLIVDNRWQEKRVVTAHLEAKGKHTNLWIDISESIPQATTAYLLNRFDKQIYPRNIEYFATESAHGKADKVNIIITDLGTLDGYFDPGDLTGQNRLNLLYLDADVAKNEPTEAENTLAHEFAHLLYYLGGGADIEWLDEGLAVYAEHINGGTPAVYVNDFRQNPDVKLTGDMPNTNNAYGAAFTFVAFAAEQVERSHNSVPEFTRALIDNSASGITGVNKVLHRYVSNQQLDSFDEIYRLNQLSGYADNLVSYPDSNNQKS